ncbi:single-stranded DNA-binding protein WHY1, chloroplastic-like [Andrographis paniculata]|uniref:single-stranded DNA-binding protein WHY1, chloroplastic-like n=1 Tax=Andrographis paniculata TaxID=175694 RepID=UPI0021E79DF3|nr:single-stranded DNA-binding protein WHY1, chloroplastic-like [Andrographis paniculata]XP_051145904.1 single-stranded DNA-binding protein WHY1, chloroplastic-like [Andrographis paniculata]
MVSLCPSVSAGGGLPIHHPSKLSSSNSLVPISARFPSRKTDAFLDTPRRGSFKLEAQYARPQEQNHQRQRFYSHGSPSPGQAVPRLYVGYSVYKGKAALTVEPRPPEFYPLDSGAFKLSKEGCVLLQFAPASGIRQYDWDRKQVFSLSVSEIGNIISLGARDSCEFYHDPYMGRSDEGKVKKVLKVEPLPDGSGHFFNLSVQNKLTKSDESIYIPITKAEFAVLVSAFNFIIPYLLGWYAFANSLKPEDSANTKDYEWSR